MVLMAYLLKQGVSYSSIIEMPEEYAMELITVLNVMDEITSENMKND